MSIELSECPNGHGPMESVTETRNVEFRGTALEVNVEEYMCRHCGLRLASIRQGAETQKRLSDAYREAKGLLTSAAIREKRRARGWTQQNLADKTAAGIASIKRWEGSQIQTEAMDRTLRSALSDGDSDFVDSGLREFSLSRTKRVVLAFEKVLNTAFFSIKGLRSTKYLWYADMVAFRELGRGMTGAQYASLPKGPQFDNYQDLVPAIKNADIEDSAELSPEEIAIIQRIARTFPGPWDVYHASHRESAWKETPTGRHIPYSLAGSLTEM